MAAVTIREPVAADRDVWAGLWSDYLAFYKSQRSVDVYDWTWDRIMSGDSDMFARLAIADERPVGLAHFLYHRSFWEPEPRCYLNDLYTAPEARGSGAGRALIASVEAHAGQRGAAGVYWLTAEDNYQARMLYDKVGERTTFIKYRSRA